MLILISMTSTPGLVTGRKLGSEEKKGLKILVGFFLAVVSSMVCRRMAIDSGKDYAKHIIEYHFFCSRLIPGI
jgi:hypothetical protein